MVKHIPLRKIIRARQVTSILLLVAIAGAVVLGRRKDGGAGAR